MKKKLYTFTETSIDDQLKLCTFNQVLAVISIGFVIVSTAALILSTIPAFQVRVFDFEVE